MTLTETDSQESMAERVDTQFSKTLWWGILEKGWGKPTSYGKIPIWGEFRNPLVGDSGKRVGKTSVLWENPNLGTISFHLFEVVFSKCIILHNISLKRETCTITQGKRKSSKLHVCISEHEISNLRGLRGSLNLKIEALIRNGEKQR